MKIKSSDIFFRQDDDQNYFKDTFGNYLAFLDFDGSYEEYVLVYNKGGNFYTGENDSEIDLLEIKDKETGDIIWEKSMIYFDEDNYTEEDEETSRNSHLLVRDISNYINKEDDNQSPYKLIGSEDRVDNSYELCNYIEDDYLMNVQVMEAIFNTSIFSNEEQSFEGYFYKTMIEIYSIDEVPGLFSVFDKYGEYGENYYSIYLDKNCTEKTIKYFKNKVNAIILHEKEEVEKNKILERNKNLIFKLESFEIKVPLKSLKDNDKVGTKIIIGLKNLNDFDINLKIKKISYFEHWKNQDEDISLENQNSIKSISSENSPSDKIIVATEEYLTKWFFFYHELKNVQKDDFFIIHTNIGNFKLVIQKHHGGFWGKFI